MQLFRPRALRKTMHSPNSITQKRYFLCNLTIGLFTLYNVCAVPWGCSVPWGVFSTVGGYHEYRGGYLEYRGGCSVPWGDIMINVGDILSTVGGVQYRGGIS